MASLIPAVCPLSGQIMLDLNSAIMRGGQVFVYQAETTTPRTVFKDYACTTAYPNPIKVNAYGRIPQIYVDIGDYKVVLKDPAGSVVDTYDHFPGGQQSASSTATPSGFTTGDLKPSALPIPQDSWVIANGGTIGNGNSGATLRANDDTFNLFVALWNAIPGLVVTPARGSSATLDFQASKTIAVPDLRGRVPAGADKMGAQTTAGRLTSATTTTPDQVGTAFGSESTILNVGQLPAFTPTITMGSAGGHTHPAACDVQGYHAHGGGTTASGDHQHTYTAPSVSNGISGTGYGAATGPYSYATSAAGNHAHNIATDGQGSHAHNITVTGVADHIHTLSASSIGNGQAHSNVAPTVLVYWHIRL